VFAGAGSGKTRVITHRIAHLVVEEGLAPWQILAVTFTNKAAGEMRDRLASMLPGGAARDVWVGTFHATSARLLRRYAETLELRRDFTIYDDTDQRAMVTRVLRDLGLDEKRYAPRTIAGAINRAKQEMRGPEDIDTASPFDEILQRVYATYEERMAAASALDFGDLIYRLARSLEGDEGFRRELQGRFHHVLVDEFQDTNHAQLRLVRALTASHRQVTVVGDDDQSIYRWRGADRRNILDFSKDFPDARVVKLEQNYRSTQRVLRAAYAIIKHNLDREPKELWTENAEGPKVTVLRCDNERQEAQLLVRAVAELRANGRSLDEIALFYRIHAQSRILEEELRGARVPYRVVGGQRFYERAEVKDILAYLRVLANPADDVSLLRIVNTPPRGIGKKSVERALDRAAEEGGGLFAAMQALARGKGATAKRYGAFLELMELLRMKATLPLHQLAKAVFDDAGYGRWLDDQNTAEAEGRIQNVGELIDSIEALVTEDPALTLTGFLERVTLDTEQSDEGDESQGRLTLMTVHAAKGLEFEVVLVAGLEEKMFPYKGVEDEDPEQLEEERRLAYVALTRAKERLILSHAETRRIFGTLRMNPRSRFLDELPPEDVDEIGRRRAPTRPKPRSKFWEVEARGPAVRERERLPPGESYVDASEGSDLSASEVFAPGAKVRHRKFGVGRVRALKPDLPPRADIDFGKPFGVKTIRVSFLEPA
jgi:DNA helicase-2/ATP-dependent DNA helicase PcrA